MKAALGKHFGGTAVVPTRRYLRVKTGKAYRKTTINQREKYLAAFPAASNCPDEFFSQRFNTAVFSGVSSKNKAAPKDGLIAFCILSVVKNCTSHPAVPASGS